MGSEGRLGATKHRKAETAVGEPLAMAIATRNGWVECITPDDRHILWHQPTGHVEPVDDDVTHWTTCPQRTTPDAVPMLPIVGGSLDGQQHTAHGSWFSHGSGYYEKVDGAWRWADENDPYTGNT